MPASGQWPVGRLVLTDRLVLTALLAGNRENVAGNTWQHKYIKIKYTHWTEFNLSEAHLPQDFSYFVYEKYLKNNYLKQARNNIFSTLWAFVIFIILPQMYQHPS